MPYAGTLSAPWFLLLALAVPATAQSPGASQQTTPHTAQLTPEARGDLAMIRREYVAAIDFYRRAPQDSPDVWNKLGMAWHHLFAMDEAKRAYEHALQLRPAYPEALNTSVRSITWKRTIKKRSLLSQSPGTRREVRDDVQQSGNGVFRRAEIRRWPRRLPERLRPGSRRVQCHERRGYRAVAARRACPPDLLHRPHLRTVRQDRGGAGFSSPGLDEGFKDREKLYSDWTFAPLRATPEFARLMSEQQLN